MPYDVDKTKDGYVIKKKGTGEVVARPKDMKGVKGYIWHASKNEGNDEEHTPFNRFMSEGIMRRKPSMSFTIEVDVYPVEMEGERETESWIKEALEHGMEMAEKELRKDIKKMDYYIKRKK